MCFDIFLYDILRYKVYTCTYVHIIMKECQNEIWHWTNDETGEVVQSWLWVRVELMAW